jgi:hypothetical protein
MWHSVISDCKCEIDIKRINNLNGVSSIQTRYNWWSEVVKYPEHCTILSVRFSEWFSLPAGVATPVLQELLHSTFSAHPTFIDFIALITFGKTVTEIKYTNAIFEVLTTVAMKITASWVISCSLVVLKRYLCLDIGTLYQTIGAQSKTIVIF